MIDESIAEIEALKISLAFETADFFLTNNSFLIPKKLPTHLMIKLIEFKQ